MATDWVYLDFFDCVALAIGLRGIGGVTSLRYFQIRVQNIRFTPDTCTHITFAKSCPWCWPGNMHVASICFLLLQGQAPAHFLKLEASLGSKFSPHTLNNQSDKLSRSSRMVQTCSSCIKTMSAKINLCSIAHTLYQCKLMLNHLPHMPVDWDATLV